MNKLLSLCGCLLAMAAASTAAVVHDLDMGVVVPVSRGEFSRVELPGGLSLSLPGEPDLPWVGARLLLPVGTKASELSVERSGGIVYHLDKALQPAQPQYPLSLGQVPPPMGPDPAVYSRSAVFPERPESEYATQYLAGHPVFYGAVCPFDYNPVTGELVCYSRIRVSVETSPDAAAPAGKGLLKQDLQTANLLARSVDNPDAVPRYTLPSSGYEYLIVHDSAKTAQWQPLRALYETRGMNVLMKSVQDIYAQYPGTDNPARIRNCISALYAANSLRYVFLAGDTDVVPVRLLYASSGSYLGSIPADIYYSSLDGNWNADGDANWGEIGEADLAPELAIGRFCYNDDTEIANFLAKLTDYLNAPEASAVKTALFVGEKLDNEPTWGGDYMDEMIGGSEANSFSTTGIPLSWDNDTLYDSPTLTWTKAMLYPLLSQGYNFINHLGHASTTYGLRLSNTDVTTTNITNDGDGENFSLIYTQGCYSGAFDSECVAERYMAIPTAAVAMVANSRYGWYAPSSTNGTSQHFHREFIDAVIDERLAETGDALADSKIDAIPFTLHSGTMHWTHYETNLFGDPAMKAWTDTPATVNAALPSAWISGLDHYAIQTNAPYANFRIKDGGEFHYEGFADAGGFLYLHPERVIQPGSYDLYVTANNFFPWHTQISFQASADPYLACLPVVYLDADGLHHTGEEIPLTVTLRNVGTGLSAPGTLSLSSPSSNIQILSGSYCFAALAEGDSIVIADVFRIGITGRFNDLASVQLVFTSEYGTFTTESHAWLVLNAPDLFLSAYQAENPSWQIEPGDQPTITITVLNRGSGNAFHPVLELTCASPWAQLSASQVALPPITSNSQTQIANVFSISVSPQAPLHAPITIGYNLDAENGPASQGEFRVYISTDGYHFENSLMGFTVEDLDPEFINEWHRDSHRNFSENGACAMKFGGLGSAYYTSSGFGALVSPAFTLGLNSQLTFRHWMAAETDTDPLQAWDGGLVEMSLDGGDWLQITPVGGYPCTIVDNPASPFAGGTPVWSGSFDWTEALFDLSSYSGSATFRWVFGSDSALTFEGWYIDDVSLSYDLPAAPLCPATLFVTRIAGGIQLSWPAVTEDIDLQPITPTGYNIYRAIEPQGVFEFLDFTPDLYYLDLEPAPRAFYRVTAVRANR